MATTTPAESTLDYPVFIWEGVNKNGVKIRGENRAANMNYYVQAYAAKASTYAPSSKNGNPYRNQK